MQHRLLFAASLFLTAHISYAQAQYTLAGQVAGTASVTLAPVVSLSGQAIYSAAGGGSGQQKSLDVDNDGVVDMVISADGSAGSGGRYPSHSANVRVRDSNVELYSYPPAGAFGYSCVGLASGDTLQPVMHRRNAAGVLGIWSSASSLNPLYGTAIYNPLLFSGVGNGANGQYSQGDWLDLQAHYAGFRLRAGSTSPWRYGWLRLQTISNANPITITIQAYALATVALSAPTARATGWQVYPTLVTDQLTLEPPTSAERGQVTVRDLCGRSVLWAMLSGKRQQLDLAGLAAGCYLVQVDTSVGHFVQRVAKQ
jgi:hypothetical protein